jgi:exodeoxyribonuclease VII large subunit
MSETIDALLSQSAAQGLADSGGKKAYTVEQYNKAVERQMKTFPRIWVKGVLTQLNARGKAVYMELADFAEGETKPRAVLPVMMWAGEFEAYAARFALLPTAFQLKAGLKVSFLLESAYYVPQGRFQPKVLDIDEAYTLGELALTRQKILEALRREGLLDANKRRVLAPVPLRVGLISAPGSAAYQDFTTVLLQSGFSFDITFAEARMQGQDTESTIAAALERLARAPLDVVCIVRGGGSKTDLVYFDSEKICRAIAACPVPVLTGIGHEIDLSLADMVAHRHFKTPTDCAKFLEARLVEAWVALRDRAALLEAAWQAAVREQLYEISRQAAALRAHWNHRRRAESDKLATSRTGLLRGPGKTLLLGRERFTGRARAMRRAWENGLAVAREHLRRNAVGLARGPGKSLLAARNALENAARTVRLADPLQRGYARVFSAAGKPVTEAAGSGPGEAILIRFRDGSLKADVRAKEMDG